MSSNFFNSLSFNSLIFNFHSFNNILLYLYFCAYYLQFFSFLMLQINFCSEALLRIDVALNRTQHTHKQTLGMYTKVNQRCHVALCRAKSAVSRILINTFCIVLLFCFSTYFKLKKLKKIISSLYLDFYSYLNFLTAYFFSTFYLILLLLEKL